MTWLQLGGIFACVAVAFLAQFRSTDLGKPRERPLYDLPRTIAVLDSEDAQYLAKFYWERKHTFLQSYYNLLMQRWNGQDERLGQVFQRVVEVANTVSGGCGDYVISNDFYSFRSQGVVQFAPGGMYHNDCDFWKIDNSDGFNLWILIDNNGGNFSFDVAEVRKNPGLYAGGGKARPRVLVPLDESDEGTKYRIQAIPRRFFSRGHHDVLNWIVNVQIAWNMARRLIFQIWRRTKGITSQGRRRTETTREFIVNPPNATNVPLRVGEALVLAEQEFHRTDLHSIFGPGQYRLAVGFKMLRRDAVLTGFDMQCSAQADRLNIPTLWEQIGQPLSNVYARGPGPLQERFRYMDSTWQRMRALAAANSGTAIIVALFSVLASPLMLDLVKFRTSLVAAFACSAAPNLGVALVQWGWLWQGSTADSRKGMRRSSAIKA